MRASAQPIMRTLFVCSKGDPNQFSKIMKILGGTLSLHKSFEFGTQKGEGNRGESALLCSLFLTQFLGASSTLLNLLFGAE